MEALPLQRRVRQKGLAPERQHEGREHAGAAGGIVFARDGGVAKFDLRARQRQNIGKIDFEISLQQRPRAGKIQTPHASAGQDGEADLAARLDFRPQQVAQRLRRRRLALARAGPSRVKLDRPCLGIAGRDGVRELGVGLLDRIGFGKGVRIREEGIVGHIGPPLVVKVLLDLETAAPTQRPQHRADDFLFGLRFVQRHRVVDGGQNGAELRFDRRCDRGLPSRGRGQTATKEIFGEECADGHSGMLDSRLCSAKPSTQCAFA